MTHLGLNLGLETIGDNVQALWNHGGQGRS